VTIDEGDNVPHIEFRFMQESSDRALMLRGAWIVFFARAQMAVEKNSQEFAKTMEARVSENILKGATLGDGCEDGISDTPTGAVRV
jgi:hypothetical protein